MNFGFISFSLKFSSEFCKTMACAMFSEAISSGTLTYSHRNLNGYSPPLRTTFFLLGIEILVRGLQKH
jgi:hypothetical protein